MKKKVSVVLPVYNERGNIRELIRQVKKYTGMELLEIIVVDDNSPDGTTNIVRGLQKKNRNLKLVVRKKERGLPSAIWSGIKKSKGNVVVWLDGDLSHPPKYIPKMLSYIGDYDVVCASRYVDKGKDARSVVRVIASQAVNLVAYVVLGLKVRDLTSGFYAVKKEVFSKVKLMQTGFAEYCIRFSYDTVKNGYKFLEIGYVSPDRRQGVSKTQRSFGRFVNDGFLCLKEIIKLRLGM
jgi:dolichol-phosphate mannosyltransferase